MILYHYDYSLQVPPVDNFSKFKAGLLSLQLARSDLY